MSLSIKALLQHVTNVLKSRGIQNPRSQARLIIAETLNKPHEYLLMYPHDLIDSSIQNLLDQVVERFLSNEPISRIFERREFWSLPFLLNSATLDPRRDSETLVEAVLKYLPDKNAAVRILDLGTGTGCLLLSLLHEYKNAQGIGTDIQKQACEMAQKNAENLGLELRATFVNTSWTQGIEKSFDVIISNPPYISLKDFENLETNVQKYDPKIALTDGIDGLECYRILAKEAPSLLKSKGIFVLEIGQGQKEAVKNIFKNTSLQLLSIHQDLAGIDRALVLTPKSNH